MADGYPNSSYRWVNTVIKLLSWLRLYFCDVTALSCRHQCLDGAAPRFSSPKPKLSGLHIFPRTRGTVKINVRLPTVPWTRRISDCPFLPRNFLITLIGRPARARAHTRAGSRDPWICCSNSASTMLWNYQSRLQCYFVIRLHRALITVVCDLWRFPWRGDAGLA